MAAAMILQHSGDDFAASDGCAFFLPDMAQWPQLDWNRSAAFGVLA
jgi:hypothetical protein